MNGNGRKRIWLSSPGSAWGRTASEALPPASSGRSLHSARPPRPHGRAVHAFQSQAEPGTETNSSSSHFRSFAFISGGCLFAPILSSLSQSRPMLALRRPVLAGCSGGAYLPASPSSCSPTICELRHKTIPLQFRYKTIPAGPRIATGRSGRLLKKGTGSEPSNECLGDYAQRRGACPLFQRAAGLRAITC